MQSATDVQMNLGWTVQIYNVAEALPNLINPFFMLPLLAVLGLRARDLVGFTFLQFIFHLPVVLAAGVAARDDIRLRPARHARCTVSRCGGELILRSPGDIGGCLMAQHPKCLDVANHNQDGRFVPGIDSARLGHAIAEGAAALPPEDPADPRLVC